MREVLDQPVYRDARKIEVVETDDLEDLLRMGEIPVVHCQNWKVNSDYNGSLLSFSADANKKLYHIKGSDSRPIAMSMTRLVPWTEKHHDDDDPGIPTILTENLYANEWSIEYGVALLGSLADKAMKLYEATGRETRLAIPVRSGHAGHQTNIQLSAALDLFSKIYNVEIYEDTLSIRPPRSKNQYEYWDCGPGKVESGKSVSINVKYISFGDHGN